MTAMFDVSRFQPDCTKRIWMKQTFQITDTSFQKPNLWGRKWATCTLRLDRKRSRLVLDLKVVKKEISNTHTQMYIRMHTLTHTNARDLQRKYGMNEKCKYFLNVQTGNFQLSQQFRIPGNILKFSQAIPLSLSLSLLHTHTHTHKHTHTHTHKHTHIYIYIYKPTPPHVQKRNLTSLNLEVSFS